MASATVDVLAFKPASSGPSTGADTAKELAAEEAELAAAAERSEIVKLRRAHRNLFRGKRSLVQANETLLEE